ncbi:MAG: sulfite exporter TauE/SafE family protein [Clostridia bacterium]|nr:sulfite exporter TauE/SafE family protein [Clostridia bacterium]
MAQIVPIVIAGIGAGFVNGLLGTGGGIVLIFALNYMLKGEKNKDIYAFTLCVTLALSVVSLFVYVGKGAVNFTESVRYGVAAIPGGIIGAYLLDRLNGKIVKRIFAVLLIVAGANMAGLF